MDKGAKVAIAVVAIAIIIVIVVLLVNMNQQPKTNLDPIKSSEDLVSLVDKVYEGQENLLPSLNKIIVDLSEADAVKGYTGLENGNDFEYMVVTEPMNSSQAYSCVIAKVKDGVDANQIAQKMSKQVDARKWICVSAEKIYATNSADVVCLVMSSEEQAKPIYDKFKTLAGIVGKEYEETYQEPGFEELPDAVPVV